MGGALPAAPPGSVLGTQAGARRLPDRFTSAGAPPGGTEWLSAGQGAPVRAGHLVRLAPGFQTAPGALHSLGFKGGRSGVNGFAR